jgi:hypothetical protein
VEPRVVQVEPAPVGELLRGREVRGAEAAARARAHQREVADHPAARAERDHHRGAEAEAAEHGEVLRVPGRGHQHRVRDLGLQVGHARPDHLRRAHGRGRVERVPAVELARVGEQLGVGGLDRDPLDRAVVAQQLDEAPVRQPGDRELGDQPQRRLEVQRSGQEPAGLGERVGAAPRRLEVRDVLEREHGDAGQPGRVDHVARRHQRAGAGGAVPVQLDVGEPLTCRHSPGHGQLRVGGKRAARHAVGGAVGEDDAPAARADQQQRRRQQVEQRLVPATARPRRLRLALDRASLSPGVAAQARPSTSYSRR